MPLDPYGLHCGETMCIESTELTDYIQAQRDTETQTRQEPIVHHLDTDHAMVYHPTT